MGCIECGGEVYLTGGGSVQCKLCGNRWANSSIFARAYKDKQTADGIKYIENEFTDDLEELILVAQRSFAEDLIKSLQQSLTDFKESQGMAKSDGADLITQAKIDGAVEVLQQLVTGFNQALNGDDDDAR